VLQLPTNYSIK